MDVIHRVDYTDERVRVDEHPKAVNRDYMIGTHPCIITEGGTRMACRNCKRYVTTYLGKWRNLGTLRKQECKPEAKRQAKRAGKAPQRQKGGALPAVPPGPLTSLTKGRAKGSNKKRKLTERPEPAFAVMLNNLQAFIEREFGVDDDDIVQATASTTSVRLG
eukprot:6212505-Amphidinium_carterae.1